MALFRDPFRLQAGSSSRPDRDRRSGGRSVGRVQRGCVQQPDGACSSRLHGSRGRVAGGEGRIQRSGGRAHSVPAGGRTSKAPSEQN